MSYLKQINWVDIFVLILLIRICYISVKTGFPTEIFKLLGTLCAIYLACHYYIRIGNFLNNRLPLEAEAWGNLFNFLAFFVLVFLGYFVFAIFRVVFTILIRMEAISLLNRWGAIILGVVRWSLLTSLLLLMVSISNIGYFKNSLSDSFLGPRLVGMAPKVYAFLWDNLTSRFMDKETFNETVLPPGPGL